VALERKLAEITPQLFIANGTNKGIIKVDADCIFRVHKDVIAEATGQPLLELIIFEITDENTIIVGIRDTKYHNRDKADISAYTIALTATIRAERQTIKPIDPDEVVVQTYERSPIAANRRVLVDRCGNIIDKDHPLHVEISSTLNIDNLNIQLHHKDNDPKPGDIHDSVRIGDGVEQWAINVNNEGLVHDQDTHDRLNLANASLNNIETDINSINNKLIDGNDIGDITVNNGTGASAVNVQDGGNSITVDSVDFDIRELSHKGDPSPGFDSVRIGNGTKIADISANNELKTTDVLDNGWKTKLISVTAGTPVEVKVDGAARANRKVISIQPKNGKLIYGDLVNNLPFELFKKQGARFAFGPATKLFIDAVSGTVSVAIAEAS